MPTNKMQVTNRNIYEISENGFTVIHQVYSEATVESILGIIANADTSKQTFRKSTNLFAIRQFLNEVPETVPFIFTENLRSIIKQLFGHDFFVVKSIYFDKPGDSNWFVAYHQDLTISVKDKSAVEGFRNWSVKENQYAVQPPLNILENNFTIRIHLDDTNVANGALRVVPGSHLKGIVRTDNVEKETALTCDVSKGGIMIMRPLLMHASGRSASSQKRRVIHIEFSNTMLTFPLEWSELYAGNRGWPGSLSTHS